MKRIALLILDGWGWSREKNSNAIIAADPKNIDYLRKNYPFFLLQASGRAVGLPPLKEGNSEVGHLTIGAGRIIVQHLTVIDESIKNGSFFENQTFVRLLKHTEINKSRIHLIGLLTSGTVHASLEHLLSIIKFMGQKELTTRVLLHLFTDGRDSGKKESINLIEKVEKEIAGSRIKISSLIGRDFAMDRDNNWNLTKKAYDLLSYGFGEKTDSFKEAVGAWHLKGTTDEVMPPILKEEKEKIEDGDGVLFLNFREDSARQLARAFVDDGFAFFETKKFKNLFFATMTDYGSGLKTDPIFKKTEIKNTLAEVLEKNGLKQLRVAETAKYAHLTYFFNGLRDNRFENETDFLIPSFENPTQNPEMKVREIAEKIIEEIGDLNFEFIAANFANPDMLSHGGDFEATVKGVKAVDEAVGRILKAAEGKEIIILITGDHGNAENLTYLGTGEKESRHNPNPVPLLIVGDKFKKNKSDEEILSEGTEIRGMLQDIAPTILALMGMGKPDEMTGLELVN